MGFASLLFIAIILVSVRDGIIVAESQSNRGVCYGLIGDNLLPPSKVINMYNRYNIRSIRIFDPNQAVMLALQNAGSKIQVTVGVKNEDIQSIAGSIYVARQWLVKNIKAYSGISISYITVGNEVIPGELAQYVLPAMENLQLAAENASLSIGITTVVSMNILASSYPPSNGTFTDASRNVMAGILNNLASKKQPLMLNVYPYFAYVSDPVNIDLDYCLFEATRPMVTDQGLGYYNMLEAMIDAVHAAAEKVGVPKINIEISETGWPSAGNGNFTTPELAGTYNRNFWARLNNPKGTPRRPNQSLSGKIFATFNENQKTEGVEQHWGLFNADGSPVYPFF